MSSEQCYCAFCKHQRRIYTKRHITPINMLLSLLAAFAIMMFLWQEFDPRVLIVFAFCLMVAEMFITIRWRVTLPCPHCGFDPVLYMRNPKKACEKVNTTIDLRRHQASRWLKGKNPMQNLTPRSRPSVKEELKLREASRVAEEMLSRQLSEEQKPTLMNSDSH